MGVGISDMKKLRITVREKGQITIPAEVRRAARLAEGDSVEVTMTAEGILLKPHKLIDATQAWFWEAAWQAREREADADLAAGRLTRHESGRDLLRSLDERMKPLDADT
jgi:antitoxin PrlF